MINRDPLILFVGLILGFVFGWLFASVNHEIDPPLTCEIAETKIWATQQCLKFQPSCPKNGVDMFIEYKQMKDFVALNCPNSGDGFLSH
jgi:hypothetical protein